MESRGARPAAETTERNGCRWRRFRRGPGRHAFSAPLPAAANGDQWTTFGEGVTNAQGRIPALFPARAAMARSIYRVTFKTGKWYADHKGAAFFPEIPVIFTADASVPHYHVPLLLSPYG